MFGKKILVIISSSFILITLFFLQNQDSSISSKLKSIDFDIPIQKNNKKTKDQHYEQSCMVLFHKLRYPNMSLFFNPALKEPPAYLLDEFTQHGQMPIKKWWYINEVYSDSKGDQSKEQRVIKQKEIDYLISRVKV